MTSILDNFSPVATGFMPKIMQDLFALRLAQKLGDVPAAAHFARLASEHSEARLLVAYHRTIRNYSGGDLGRLFHTELERTNPNVQNGFSASLISIRVERRAVAGAIFHGDHLEYADSRQLSSARDKAVASAAGFVNWLLDRFPVESAVLEAIPNGVEFQRRALHEAICQALREQSLPLWEISKVELLQGCGYPALKSRQQLRDVATSIWPVLAGTHAKIFMQDAAILGLHAQIERHFILH